MTGPSSAVEPDMPRTDTAAGAPISRKPRELNVAVHGLRGVASLMVLFAHLLGGTAAHIYADRPEYVAGIKPFWNFGTFGVMLFFMISGFVILPSVFKYSPKEFALRRFFRLYPLFLFATVLFAVLNGITNHYPQHNNFASIFYSLTFLDLFTSTEQIAPNAWSLTYEVMFYTLAYAVFWVFSRKIPKFCKILFLVVPIWFLVTFPNAFFFLAGAAIFWLHRNEMLNQLRFARVFEITALCACIYLASLRHLEYRQTDFSGPLAYLTILSTAIYFTFAISNNSFTSYLLNNKIALYFGTVSYSLYLIHPYSYFIARWVFVKLGLFTDNIFLSMTGFFIATTFLTIIVTHAVHVALERQPYQWFFKQGVYRGRSAKAV
jgi:peptidoglycan/LPS O-acetylase OafA/YrhL